MPPDQLPVPPPDHTEALLANMLSHQDDFANEVAALLHTLIEQGTKEDLHKLSEFILEHVADLTQEVKDMHQTAKEALQLVQANGVLTTEQSVKILEALTAIATKEMPKTDLTETNALLNKLLDKKEDIEVTLKIV